MTRRKPETPEQPMVTIFEQDGRVYCALTDLLDNEELARETAKAIRGMARIPRAKMRVVTLEDAQGMPYGTPKKA